MEFKVVYWPRHLWTATASASSVLCQRLSPDALCVVSLDTTPSAGLELLPAKSSTPRRVVLFDAQVAALGTFESFHAPHLMQQIGKLYTDVKTANVAPTTATWKVVEAMAFYVLFVPFAALLAPTTAIQHWMHDTRTPAWLVAGGGKRVADLSTFLSVLCQQVHNAAGLPHRLRHLYRITKTRRLSRQEKVQLLQSCNLVGFILLDMAFGQLLHAHVMTARRVQTIINYPELVVDFMRRNVEWLMGAPAGFKLNKPLALILGNGILLWLHLWSFMFEQLAVVAGTSCLNRWSQLVLKSMGMTLQVTLLAEMVSLLTWHSQWVYLYFAKLNRLQFGLFSSLWKLFIGKKTNVLRHRVDTCEYNVGQLLLGTLLFTILTFLVTTNLVFFVFFAAVRGSIEVISLLLWLPVVALSSLPIASLGYRWWDPRFFIVGMELRPYEGSADTDTVIANVGVGRQLPQLDAQHQKTLRQAVAAWKNTNQSTCDDAIFQLVPIPSSFSAQVTRTRQHAYLCTVGARYSLAVIVKACLFGSTGIPQVPWTVLFRYWD